MLDFQGFLNGGGKGIRTHAPVRANGFQDFFRNPTLTQNNRKYQTVENAENPVKSRDIGVLSCPINHQECWWHQKALAMRRKNTSFDV